MKRVEVRPYGVSKGAAISRILEQLSALEAEHVLLSHSNPNPNQHSRGHAFHCLPPFSAVCTGTRSPSYARAALTTLHGTVVVP